MRVTSSLRLPYRSSGIAAGGVTRSGVEGRIDKRIATFHIYLNQVFTKQELVQSPPQVPVVFSDIRKSRS